MIQYWEFNLRNELSVVPPLAPAFDLRMKKIKKHQKSSKSQQKKACNAPNKKVLAFL